MGWSLKWLLCSISAILAGGPTNVQSAPPVIPDPCRLITVAELEQIVGPLEGVPRHGDIEAGEVWCEYTPVEGPSFINISLHDGELKAWRERNGDENSVSLPAFGADAFLNPDFQGYTDLYAKKGDLILEVSMPVGPTAVERVKAITEKALSRM